MGGASADGGVCGTAGSDAGYHIDILVPVADPAHQDMQPQPYANGQHIVQGCA